MAFLQANLRCTLAQQPAVEEALEAMGALSVTLADAHADAADEQAIFEPGVGEMPLWNDIVVQALFEADADPAVLREAVLTQVDALDGDAISFEHIADQDWERVWMDRYEPMSFGQRLWVYPSSIEPPSDADIVVVKLDPGLAFGSGTHPTTALCLEWLDELAGRGELGGKRVLDFGCGSGILAIAALKLGAQAADGVDNDPQALVATTDNAERNAVQLAVYLPEHDPAQRYPVVVANILANALDALVEVLAARTEPGGRIALSGILDGQEDELLLRYAPYFSHLRVSKREDWIRIDGVRRH